SIDVSSLPSGVYLLAIKSATATLLTERIVVQ
ncbi:MAG: hypothetical protein ACI9R6_000724, partial [Saprospiraceae bacterium]